jgi:uncharacterized protein GlcG (DUF336 family)
VVTNNHAQVNRRPVISMAALRQALAAQKGGAPMLVQIHRKDASLFVATREDVMKLDTRQTDSRRRSVAAAGGAILALLLWAGSSGASNLPTEKVLPLSLAREAALGALTACERQGFHASVAITDRAGLVRVLMRDDQAGPHTLDTSVKKAYTAASLGLSTGALTQILMAHPEATGLRDMNGRILIMQGGLPIQAGTETIGGIGVGGTPGGETDEACARAGLDKILNRLQ